MTITNIDALSVKAGFAETDATKLKVGQPAAVSFSALPERAGRGCRNERRRELDARQQRRHVLRHRRADQGAGGSEAGHDRVGHDHGRPARRRVEPPERGGARDRDDGHRHRHQRQDADDQDRRRRAARRHHHRDHERPQGRRHGRAVVGHASAGCRPNSAPAPASAGGAGFGPVAVGGGGLRGGGARSAAAAERDAARCSPSNTSRSGTTRARSRCSRCAR